MKTLMTLFALFIASAAVGAADEQLSPSGRFLARAEIPEGVRHVSVLLSEVDGKSQQLVFTKAAGAWAIAWSASDVLLLIAEDADRMAVDAFEAHGNQFSERKPTESEAKLAFEAFEKKHRRKPNQAPQRNAGSRPSSDDSAAFETPSSPGPRG